jgi:hypothetical protein
MKIPLSQIEAKNLYLELLYNQLEVQKSGPIDKTGRCRRDVINKNPDWYRELFHQYYHGSRRGKGSRSRVRRQRVLTALKRLSDDKYLNSFHCNLMVDLIRSRLYEGYYVEKERIYIPPQLKPEPWEDE